MKKRPNSTKASWAAGILAAIGSLALINCAREPRLKIPPIGETMLIKPIAVNFTSVPRVAKPEKAVRLDVMWGGRAISKEKGNPILRFYKNPGDAEPAFSKYWSELAEAYKSSGCSNDQIATMDGYLMGTALICDGSFNLENIKFIEAQQDNGEKHMATSWSSYPVSEDVTGYSIGLY